MTRYIGIVGHGAEKFNARDEKQARTIIQALLEDPASVLVSGRSPMGGIDIWAEEEADRMRRQKLIFPAEHNRWKPDGFEKRNLSIAARSETVNVLVVKEYPKGYTGMRFERCYHCNVTTHKKSGGCWTGIKALEFGNNAEWLEIG